MSGSRQAKILITMWALGGFLVLIGFAMTRLIPRASELLDYDLSPIQVVILVLWIIFMVWSEGYDGFYKRFAPRFASRVVSLLKQPKPLDVLLAPLYCMHYFAAPRRRMIVAWTTTGLIICAIILIGLLSPPWRNIIDVGVIAGLAFGTVVTIIFTIGRVKIEFNT